VFFNPNFNHALFYFIYLAFYALLCTAEPQMHGNMNSQFLFFNIRRLQWWERRGAILFF